ncbi:DMT family transporter [Streptomyces pathocidini]|uniref:DMT family transporter n=1 Tax=Streptomyces pathocidini TaxID=1650571 RepID=A0ABW7UV88_9ACTN|nr:DMT family transporter [Streptomyces pathocidini]
MTGLAVALALLSALSNAVASVLQRRAAAEEKPVPRARRTSWVLHLLRRPIWLLGTFAMIFSGVSQAGALAAGPLSVVQPVLTTELLFTLVVGSAVFHRRPDHRTWWAFLAMAAGLAAFLRLAEPARGVTTVPDDRWLPVALPVLGVVLVLLAVARHLSSAPRAAVLGTATALGFSWTAALMKDAIGQLPEGVGAFFTAWQTYAFAAVGLASFLLLQMTLGAGTLVASQPALTLGDALLSVVLGAVLFDEQITLGLRILPEAVALAVLVLGSIQLARSPVVSGEGGEDVW